MGGGSPHFYGGCIGIFGIVVDICLAMSVYTCVYESDVCFDLRFDKHFGICYDILISFKAGGGISQNKEDPV